ncbi:MAG TPA: hypothetical protein VN956_01110 [Pyrinomonadaceae bacterium]|nr:hypothetical protein [Pyrinomonadaceae bacterium]
MSALRFCRLCGSAVARLSYAFANFRRYKRTAGSVLWLDTDTKIRELSRGTRSLDDFCKKFHRAPSTAPAVKTYGFEDVVAALNEVAPFDWRNFLLARLNSTDFHAPLGGIERAGWKLAYETAPSGFLKDLEQWRKQSRP